MESGLNELLGANLQINYELKVGTKAKAVVPEFKVQAGDVPDYSQTDVRSSYKPVVGKKLSTQMPVATEEDDALVKFAEEIFGK